MCQFSSETALTVKQLRSCKLGMNLVAVSFRPYKWDKGGKHEICRCAWKTRGNEGQ